jgi:tetratricopeptide (TPR) repeat protein
MAKLQQQTDPLNDGDRLRKTLSDAERIASPILRTNARALLLQVHSAMLQAGQVEASGGDIRPERGRLDTLIDRVERNARLIVSGVGGRTAFDALRTQTAGANPADRLWQLDTRVAEHNRSRLRMLGAALGVIALIAGLGVVFREQLFPPDPAGDAIRAAQRLVSEKDIPGAKQQIELGLQTVPADPELNVWRGVLLELSADPGAAAEAARAKASMPERDYLIYRASAFVSIGEPDRVLTETTQLLQTNPDSAEAYFLRASAYEDKGDREAAVSDLQRAADLAEAQGNAQLNATARVRLGMLLQQR